MTDDLVRYLKGASRHPYMDNTCNLNVFKVAEAADRIEAQAAEIERLRVEAEAHYDRGYYDGSTHLLEQHDALKKARGAINGLLDIVSEENLDSEQAGRAFAALHEIGTALEALGQGK
jgi:uncharacterized small protein (DUF1192 family)